MQHEVIDLLKAFGQSRIPSLVLLTVLFYIGGNIIVQSKNIHFMVGAGSCLILLGIILAIFSYGDYRHKEHIDRLEKSYRDIINTYQSALEGVSKTHTTVEKEKQRTFTKSTESKNTGQIGEYSTASILGTDDE